MLLLLPAPVPSGALRQHWSLVGAPAGALSSRTWSLVSLRGARYLTAVFGDAVTSNERRRPAQRQAAHEASSRTAAPAPACYLHQGPQRDAFRWLNGVGDDPATYRAPLKRHPHDAPGPDVRD